MCFNYVIFAAVQLVDKCGSGQMNFRSFVQLFGVMSRTTLQERLKLVFTLHIKELTRSRGPSVEGKGSLENSSNVIESGEKMTVGVY